MLFVFSMQRWRRRPTTMMAMVMMIPYAIVIKMKNNKYMKYNKCGFRLRRPEPFGVVMMLNFNGWKYKLAEKQSLFEWNCVFYTTMNICPDIWIVDGRLFMCFETPSTMQITIRLTGNRQPATNNNNKRKYNNWISFWFYFVFIVFSTRFFVNKCLNTDKDIDFN